MIPDDRLIYNTLPCWEFGADDDGNLMKRSTLEALRRRVKTLASISPDDEENDDDADDDVDGKRGVENKSCAGAESDVDKETEASSRTSSRCPSRAASTASPGPAGTTSTTAPPHEGKPAPRGVHLVTADGSVNCVDTPADQENVVAALHWCETVAALMILEQGESLMTTG